MTTQEDQLPKPVLPGADMPPQPLQTATPEPPAPPAPIEPAVEPEIPPPTEVELAPVAADLKPDPPRGRGRPKKNDQIKAKVLTEAESDKYDYDSWINSFDWQQPGMQCKVERISPEMVGVIQTSGTCGVFDNMPLSTQQIQQMFGGGRYHISVIGPRDSKKGVRILRLSHKPLKIPGQPNLENLGRIGQPKADAASQPTPRQTPAGGSDPTMVKLVDSMIQPLQRRVDAAGQQGMASAQMVGQQLQDAANMKIAATDQMLAEKDRLVQTQLQQATDQVNAARQEANKARQEKEQAMNDARDAQARIFEDRRMQEEQLAERLRSVQGDSNNLIATLLPQAQQQAQNQINAMMTMFETRISSQEASYSSRLEGLEQSYRQRMASQADLFKIQIESTTNLYQGQIQHLQTLLTQAQGEKTMIMGQLDDARKRVLEEISKLNKAKDPEEQMVKMASLMETVKGIAGIGGGEEAAPTSGNAFFDGIMGNIGKITEVIPHIAGAVSAKAQADVAAAGMHQQQMPQQQMMPQQQQPQLAPPQQLVQQPPPEVVEEPQEAAPQPQPEPRRRRRPDPQAKPKPKGKIPRGELDKAVTIINSALSSNPNIDPSDFANMAISSVDNDSLRRLSRQKSELVVGELEKMGVLHGQVSTDDGKEWLCKLLDVLREKL